MVLKEGMIFYDYYFVITITGIKNKFMEDSLSVHYTWSGDTTHTIHCYEPIELFNKNINEGRYKSKL